MWKAKGLFTSLGRKVIHCSCIAEKVVFFQEPTGLNFSGFWTSNSPDSLKNPGFNAFIASHLKSLSLVLLRSRAERGSCLSGKSEKAGSSWTSWDTSNVQGNGGYSGYSQPTQWLLESSEMYNDVCQWGKCEAARPLWQVFDLCGPWSLVTELAVHLWSMAWCWRMTWTWNPSYSC